MVIIAFTETKNYVMGEGGAIIVKTISNLKEQKL